MMPPTIQAWVDADRRQELDVMQSLLAPDVELVSPLTDAFTFQGSREVMAVFASAFDLLKEIEIVRVTGADRDWVIHGRQRMRGANMEEIQWLRLNDAGEIDHITLFIRPAHAVIETFATIAGGLHQRQVMPRNAVVASAPLRIFSAVLRLIERRVMARLGPRR